MSEIYLVRHGQASFASANYDQLSPLGYEQGALLGDYFHRQGIDIDVAVHGSLLRQQQTAEAILSAMPACFASTTELASLNEFAFREVVAAYLRLTPEHAVADNAPRADFYRLLKRSMFAWQSNQLDNVPESWEAFSTRAQHCIEHIQQHYLGKRVLVVSSGGIIAMMVSLTLKTALETVVELNLQIKNTSVSHFYFNDSAMRLSSFNHTPHLDSPDLRNKITFS